MACFFVCPTEPAPRPALRAVVPALPPAGPVLLLQALRRKVAPDLQVSAGANLIQDAVRYTLQVRSKKMHTHVTETNFTHVTETNFTHVTETNFNSGKDRHFCNALNAILNVAAFDLKAKILPRVPLLFELLQ